MQTRPPQNRRQSRRHLRKRHHDHSRSEYSREQIMALHPNFPDSPFVILDPSIRWFPADEALRETTSDKLMPPLVPELRKKVKEWRECGYSGEIGRASCRERG